MPLLETLSPQSKKTISFMVILSFVCALVLSVLASALKEPQEVARDLDRSTQMLIATRIISPYNYFQVQDEKGAFVPAKYVKGGHLVPSGAEKIAPSGAEVLEVYNVRIKPFLVDRQGKATTFKAAGIDEGKYLADYKKKGYYLEPLKLIYQILPNPTAQENKDDKVTLAQGYVIPVNGMGLWDAIYGYLAIQPDGNTVIGISWYDQKETPGLGANIAEADWQQQFPGKHIFQEGPEGKTDFKTAPLGLTVVKGKVSEVLGGSPKALSAVDGMAGATLTGNGVTDGYRDVLAAYKPFLLRVNQESGKR